MLFKDLKAGFPIHMFDRANLHYEQGKVMNVGLPKPDMKPGNYGKMQIDVAIQTEKGTNTYELTDSERSAYAGSLLLSTDKECVVAEINLIKTQSEDAISKVEEQKLTIKKCNELLENLDTTFRDKQETEHRFQKMEENFFAMDEKVGKLLSLMERKGL